MPSYRYNLQITKDTKLWKKLVQITMNPMFHCFITWEHVTVHSDVSWGLSCVCILSHIVNIQKACSPNVHAGEWWAYLKLETSSHKRYKKSTGLEYHVFVSYGYHSRVWMKTLWSRFYTRREQFVLLWKRQSVVQSKIARFWQ